MYDIYTNLCISFFGVLLLTHTICSEVSLNGFRSETVIVILLERIISLSAWNHISSESAHESRPIDTFAIESICVARNTYILYLYYYLRCERECAFIHRFRNFGCLRRFARSNSFHCNPGIWRRNFLTLGRERPFACVRRVRARIDNASERMYGRFPCSRNWSELSSFIRIKIEIADRASRVALSSEIIILMS